MRRMAEASSGEKGEKGGKLRIEATLLMISYNSLIGCF